MKGKNLIALFGLPCSGVNTVAQEIAYSQKYMFDADWLGSDRKTNNRILLRPNSYEDFKEIAEEFENSKLIQVDAPYRIREKRHGGNGIKEKDLLHNASNNLISLILNKDYTIDNSRHMSYLEHQIDELLFDIDPLRSKLATSKRENHISWNEFYMGLAVLASKRSKDPSTQTGACIVSLDNEIMSIGYNGFPNGCSDDDFPWASQDKDILKTKDLFVAHAESNAIANRGPRDIKGCKLYVTLYPCNSCTQQIIQNGISEVYYLGEKNKRHAYAKASERMLQAANVKVEKISFAREHIHLMLKDIWSK